MQAAAKVQCNVYLPPELVRAIKHRAIDEGVSLSACVERALTAYLESVEEES
ncbi:CopG family transcriptional regulator [Ruania halotolerans]|uniref:ribbon-helix-helix domain-containing protein n=1 Tax=Ruania halotolerans TaxID=2897773 RepID=UPI001E4B5DBB|nr:CopG family transcriptional regulator [Ruania halotolerans]UFU06550.1 ribbon-helix-helix domain-containing protein [Ruania halotolerans]